jgi:uncharacterized protein (DUF4415 family)
MPRYTGEELRELIARGESRSDLAQAKAMTEKEIDAAIAEDPDERDMPEDWYLHAKLVIPKQPISIRLDTDLIEYFRGTGRGWQTRINNVLRAYKEAMGQ